MTVLIFLIAGFIFYIIFKGELKGLINWFKLAREKRKVRKSLKKMVVTSIEDSAFTVGTAEELKSWDSHIDIGYWEDDK